MKPIICIMVALFGPTLQHDTRCRKVFCDHFGASAVTNLDGYGALGPFVGNKRNLAIYNQGRYLFFGWIYFATNCKDCVQNFCFAIEKVGTELSRELIQRWTDTIQNNSQCPIIWIGQTAALDFLQPSTSRAWARWRRWLSVPWPAYPSQWMSCLC